MAEILGEHLQRTAQAEAQPETVLIVQGGGMRGAYSIGALATLEEVSESGGIDLRNSFSSTVSSSAGSMNVAHWAAGYAREGVSIYTDDLTTGEFIPRTEESFLTVAKDMGHVVMRGGRLVDIDFLVDDVLQRQGRLTEFKGRMTNYAVATDAKTGKPVMLRMSPDDPEAPDLYEVFRATAALPSLYNKKIKVNGRKYVDGGATSSIPLASTVSLDPKPKHVVAILTRPNGHRNPPRGLSFKIGAALMSRGTQSLPVVKLIMGQNEVNYNEDLDRIESADGIDPETGIRFTLIQPSDPERLVGRTTADRRRIVDCAEMGKADMARALEEALVPA